MDSPMSKPLIGKLLDSDLNPTRDAIHVPIIPVYAGEVLQPGQKIALIQDAGKLLAFSSSKASEIVGIVDPYLEKAVVHDQYFYCHLKPNSVSKLWHEWKHPKIDAM
jgi:hypothetical protein